MIKLLFLLSLVVLFFSCTKGKIEKFSNPLVLKDGLLYSDSLSTKPYTGRHKSRMLDMKIEYEVLDGKIDGDFITYFPNDEVQISGTMRNNKNEGEWKYYFPTGSIETIGNFENDIPNGKWTWYNQDRQIIEEGSMLNGLREGEWKNYDTNGILNIVRIYKEDKLIDSVKVN